LADEAKIASLEDEKSARDALKQTFDDMEAANAAIANTYTT
jgi:hypothetical protein